MQLSVVIPTWNESRFLARTLDSLQARAGGAEVICADGGSTDGTIELAQARGLTLVQSVRGRGTQLHAGAGAARGDLLWFLHADTTVECEAGAQIAAACNEPGIVGGNFRLRFEGGSGGARFLNAIYPRLAWLGLRYGDSGIFVRRTAYAAAGGFRPLPIFEDLDLLARLRGIGRLTTLPGPLTTSSRRFSGRPFVPVFLRWAWLQILYCLGCDPVRLGRLYYPDLAQLPVGREVGARGSPNPAKRVPARPAPPAKPTCLSGSLEADSARNTLERRDL